MTMWLYFSQAMQFASDSTVSSRELIAKVWFPRMIIPLAAVIPPAIDFVPAFVVALIVQLAYGIVPPVQIVLVPLLMAVTLFVALGAGLWLSALNVRYRDIRLAVPFLIMVGLFVTPIVYPFDSVPEAVQPFYAINPLVGVLETFRWMLFPRGRLAGRADPHPVGHRGDPAGHRRLVLRPLRTDLRRCHLRRRSRSRGWASATAWAARRPTC